MVRSRRLMRRPLENTIISWWRERDLRPELAPCLRHPPSLAVPLNDEEVLVAMLILMQYEQDSLDPKALMKGKLRAKRSHVVWQLFFPGLLVVLIAFEWVMYGRFSVPITADEIPRICYVMLAMAVFGPLAAYGMLMLRLKTAQVTGCVLVGGPTLVILATFWFGGMFVSPWLANFTQGPVWHLVSVGVALLLICVVIMGLSLGAMLGVLLGAVHNERAVS